MFRSFQEKEYDLVDVFHSLDDGEIAIDRRPTVNPNNIDQDEDDLNNTSLEEEEDDDEEDEDEDEDDDLITNEIPRQRRKGYHASTSPTDFVKKKYKSSILEVYLPIYLIRNFFQQIHPF